MRQPAEPHKSWMGFMWRLHKCQARTPPTALGCPKGVGFHVSQPDMKALCLTDKLAQQASVKQARSRIMFYG